MVELTGIAFTEHEITLEKGGNKVLEVKFTLRMFKGIVFNDSKQHKPMSELESILEKYGPEIITHK